MKQDARIYRLVTELAPTRLQHDGNATQRALMVAGEAMMAEDGLDAPPLHAIAAAAGCANKYAVQYHFGDRSRLIHAILAARAAAIAARRGDLLVEAATRGLVDDPAALIEAMVLPLAEQVGEDGAPTFPRFMLLTMTQPWHAESMEVLEDVQDDANTVRIIAQLGKALPKLDRLALLWRLRIQVRTLLTCLVEHDSLARVGRQHQTRTAMLADALAMVRAAIAG